MLQRFKIVENNMGNDFTPDQRGNVRVYDRRRPKNMTLWAGSQWSSARSWPQILPMCALTG